MTVIINDSTYLVVWFLIQHRRRITVERIRRKHCNHTRKLLQTITHKSQYDTIIYLSSIVD